MKLLLICNLMLVSSTICKSQNLSEVRKLYIDASNSSKANDKMHEILKSDRPYEIPEMEGYYAMSYFLMSKYAFNPFRKFDHFSVGRQLMDSIIDVHPENLELRYLRNMVQIKVPGFLDYDINIDEDRDFIVAGAAKEVDPQLIEMINDYFVECEKYFNKRQKQN